MKDIRVIFMGTPSFAVPILEMLDLYTNVVGVVTQPDKLVGRKHVLTYSPVKNYALEHKLNVIQPVNIKEDYKDVLDIDCDLIITCAYGQILPKEILDKPYYGCINVHASLLPKYRGGAPIHWALINGEEKTGITIMYMSSKMDAGDIISESEYYIKEDDTTEDLHNILSELGASSLKKELPKIINHTNSRIKQNEEEVTYAYNIQREDEHLDFSLSGRDIINKIRGLYSWPLAYFLLNGEEYKAIDGYFVAGKSLESKKVLDIKKDAIGISCLDGIVYLTKIKPFGKKIMDVKSYLNGINKDKLKEAIID